MQRLVLVRSVSVCDWNDVNDETVHEEMDYHDREKRNYFDYFAH